MDLDNAYFECLLEEYKQCKSEISILQKYQWRVQMLYVPTLIITILGFYMKEIWSSDPSKPIQLSYIVQNLFNDHAFITLILWSALISILIVIFTGNMMIREGRYIAERVIPNVEKLIQREGVFYWERVCTERLPISPHRDDSLQLYGDVIYGSLLLLLPFSIGVMCIFKGILCYIGMSAFIKYPFLIGTAVFILSVVSASVGLAFLEIRKGRAIKKPAKNKDACETDHHDAGAQEDPLQVSGH